MSEDSSIPSEFVAPELEELNQLIPGYEFIDFIAKGGMGAVYLARQSSLDRLVAIKVLPPVLCQDEGFKASFETEAKLMAKLNHPNLIGIYDFGDINGMLYIVMEYVQGQSLFHSSVGKMIEQATAVKIVSGVCEGLEHAHEVGMLHRDVKPANILLNTKAVPKIGDFGLARPSEMTETGVIFGTPDYLAPEVLGAPDRVDKRTDIFAVGVILYELLTGQLPRDPYIPVQNFADIDPRFDPIIRRAMNPDIERRYSTATDFAENLENVINNPRSTNRLLTAAGSTPASQISLGSGVRPNTGGAGLQAGSQTGAMQYTKPVLSAKSSSGGGMVLGILAAVALLGGGFIFLNSGGKAKKSTTEEKAKEEEAALLAAREKKRIEQKRSEDEAKDRAQAAGDKTNTISSTISPLEQLENIKSNLIKGERPMEDMPETIFKLGGDSRILMFVNTPMTWREAGAWAEKRGGYLSVCSEASDLTTLGEKMEGAKSVWLGGGNTVDSKWAWVDGSPWHDSLVLSTSKKTEFISLSKEGSLAAHPSEKRFPFFIEWRADGSNPASLAERLGRTGATLSLASPTYPVGTVAFSGRKYFMLADALSNKDAVAMVKKSGGKLLAMSDSEEFDFVSNLIDQEAVKGDAFWTAAIKEDQIWKWNTGESWPKMHWEDAGIGGGTIAVLENTSKPQLKPLAAKKALKTAKYQLIIEWSKDSENAIPVEIPATLSDLTDLKRKADVMVDTKKKDTEKKYRSNITKLILDLNALKRQLDSRKQAAQLSIITKVTSDLDDKSRVPADTANLLKSKKAKDAVDFALKKQAEIGETEAASIVNLKNSYVKRLTQLSEEMLAVGQVSMSAYLKKEIAEVENSFEDYLK